MGGTFPQVQDCEASDVVDDGALDVEDLLRLILAQCNGGASGAPIPSGLREIVFETELDGAHYTLVRAPVDSPHSDVSLSPRETEIVRLVSKGLANKTIALVLEISPWTVATHLRRVFAKLQVNSRAEMVARVYQEAIVEPGECCYAARGVACPFLEDSERS
jgi:DNA-binding CsgD family transcriptional regulator